MNMGSGEEKSLLHGSSMVPLDLSLYEEKWSDYMMLLLLVQVMR